MSGDAAARRRAGRREDAQLEREGSAAAHARQLRNGIISLVLLGALVVGLLFAIPGLHGVGRALRNVDIDTLAAAIALEFLSCMGYVVVFQLVFARAPRRFAARLAWTEMAFGSALSFGGAGSIAVGAWVLHSRLASPPIGSPGARRCCSCSPARSTLIVLVVTGVLLGLGLVSGPTNPLLTFLPAGIGATVFGLFLCIPAWARRFAPSDERGTRLTRLLLGFADSIRDTRAMLVTADCRPARRLRLPARGHRPRVVRLPRRRRGGATARGRRAPPDQNYLANIIPVPGGIGVLDAGLVGMLVLYGAPAASSAAAVLIYHAVALWVTSALDTIAFLLLRRTIGQPLSRRPLPEPRRAPPAPAPARTRAHLSRS